MTPTKTILPIEVVEQSEKLQGLNTSRLYCKWLELGDYKWTTEHNKIECYGGSLKKLPAPSIADIIDNAEELFSKYDGILTGLSFVAKTHQNEILRLCQQNKSIEEISKYILKNII